MFLNEMYFEQLKQDREREFASRIRVPRQRPQVVSIRQSVGRSIMSIGARLAAEPQPALARSR
jgi:hypothetical protein